MAQHLIKERLQWDGNNFILCIPLELDEEDYKIFKYFFNKLHPKCWMYQRKTIHISFGRFRLKTQSQLKEMYEILKQCKLESISEVLEIRRNKFQEFGNYYALIFPKVDQISKKIYEYFKSSKPLYKHDFIPHITIGLTKETQNCELCDSVYISNMKYIKEISMSNLQIIATSPIKNSDGEDEYLIVTF